MKIGTPENPVRFCFLNVYTPTAMQEGSQKKYNMCIVIPKDHPQIPEIEEAISKIIADTPAFTKNGKTIKLKLPMRDGDEEREGDAAFEGCYFINAASVRKPGIVDKQLRTIVENPSESQQEMGNISPKELYAGCYGRVSVNFYAFDLQTNKGVACGLNNIQFLEDGERLAGAASAESDFGDIDFGSDSDEDPLG